MQEENANAPSDIKDMQKILIDKSNIGTPMQMKYGDLFDLNLQRLL